MGESLRPYVQSRVHELVDTADYRRIVVLGSYDRSLVVSRKEKSDKLENWQRPTAVLRKGELQIHCYPGRAYVFHYGSLIATHLVLTGRDPGLVDIILPSPSSCWAEISRSGLVALEPTASLIVASGNEMLATADSAWADHGVFATRTESYGSSTFTWLAVKHSFWGDIAFHLGKALATAGFPLIIFVGKLGSLVSDHEPNVTLATGASSVIGGTCVSWTNVFESHSDPCLVSGRHITLPSVLQETVTWRNNQENHFEFVDPEIGNLAVGVQSGGARFSYIHIISDNLSRKYKHDLSNEREPDVIMRRAAAYGRLGQLIRRTLSV
jgi:hypothetical protein